MQSPGASCGIVGPFGPTWGHLGFFPHPPQTPPSPNTVTELPALLRVLPVILNWAPFPKFPRRKLETNGTSLRRFVQTPTCRMKYFTNRDSNALPMEAADHVAPPPHSHANDPPASYPAMNGSCTARRCVFASSCICKKVRGKQCGMRSFNKVQHD